jgi:hypothetical protein
LQVRALPPEPMSSPPDAADPAGTGAPPATGRQPTSTGCLWLILLAPVAIVVGLVVGALASGGGGDGPSETSTRLDAGEAGGQAWHVDAVRDVDGDTCIFLYLDDEQLTGACTTTPQDATLTDTLTVVFGKAPREAPRVRVGLSDGRDVEVDTVEARGFDGRFYVTRVEGDADLDVTGALEALGG